MRLLLAAVVVAALGLVGRILYGTIRDSHEWNELVSCADKDLSVLGPAEQSRLKGYLHRRLRGEDDRGDPIRRVLILEGPHQQRRVLFFRGSPSTGTLRRDDLTIDVFDGDRRHLDRTTAEFGWHARGAPIHGDPKGAGFPWCFEVLGSRDVPEAAFGRQIYSLVEDQPALIRLEDEKGAVLPNSRGSQIGAAGTRPPFWLPAEWEAALRDPDLGSVLCALSWLGGPCEWNSHEEPINNRQRWLDAKARPGVRSRVMELRGHEHPWVAEAARAVEY
jgi:hypothetical protein